MNFASALCWSFGGRPSLDNSLIPTELLLMTPIMHIDQSLTRNVETLNLYTVRNKKWVFSSGQVKIIIINICVRVTCT